MPDPDLILIEWDWCICTGGDRLHHVRPTNEWPDEVAGPGISGCGRTREWWSIPGIFTRMDTLRCERCCTRLGYPQGVGSPKNDPECVPLVGARIAEMTAFDNLGGQQPGADKTAMSPLEEEL